MSARRGPAASIPAKHRKALEEAVKSGSTLELDGIAIYPPGGSRATWRTKQHINGRAYERSGGPTLETAYAAYLTQLEFRAKEGFSTTGRPALERRTVAEMVEAYVTRGGKNGRWNDTTTQDRRRDFAELVRLGDRVSCENLTAAHVRRFICSAGTAGRGQSLRNITGTLLAWGYEAGYLTEGQSRLAHTARWTAPEGSTYRAAPTRRDQAKAHAPSAGAARGGNVMTHAQLDAFAKECQKRYGHGALLIHASANLGTRSAETRLLTADPKVQERQLGNYVDLEAMEVRVRFQVSGADQQGSSLPKVSKVRDIVIPPDGFIASKFKLQDALRARCEEALREQAAGTNPRALLFPVLGKGLVWDEGNLRSDVWGPAAIDLGWRMPASIDAKGRSRSLLRFTLHSLRDRWATTAINEWKYTEAQVLVQGSWSNPETVRRFYAGWTDDTHSSVRAKFGMTA